MKELHYPLEMADFDDVGRFWRLFGFCPICGEKYNSQCRCFKTDRTCPNGHHWHFCVACKKMVIGKCDHGKATNACNCGD